MSFSRSKRFSQALNESLPGPAHYYVNWGSFGLLELTFSRIPGLTEICRKTTQKTAKVSPQKVKHTAQAPENHSSISGLQINGTIRESSKKRKGEAAKKEEVQGQVTEKTKNSSSSVMHRNIVTRESFRRRAEEAARKVHKEPTFQQLTRQVNHSIEKPSLKLAPTNDNIHNSKSVPRVRVKTHTLHSLLPVRRDFFREKTTRVPLTDLNGNKVTQNSDDKTSKIGCGSRKIIIERNSMGNDDNKENIAPITNITERNLQELQLSSTGGDNVNISQSTTNISEKNLQDMQSYTDDEVLELLDLCIEETDFLKKMELLQRLSDLQKRDSERIAMNLSDIVEVGHRIFNRTM